MRKLIFILSACAIISPILSQQVIAKTAVNKYVRLAQNNADTVEELPSDDMKIEAVEVPQTNAAKPKVKKKLKKRKNTVSTIVMKDQPPAAEVKPASWLDNLSGNMTLASNYVFRGISQTQNLPAVQGGLTYQFPVGLYANVWGSNVKFQDTNANLELDTIAGWRGDFLQDFSYDVNLDRYNYVGEQGLSYNELNSILNYKILQLGFSYSANVYATHRTGKYYLVGLNYDIPAEYLYHIENVSIHGSTGHYSLPRAAGNSYNDYSAWISKGFKSYTFTVQWTATNGRQHSPPVDGNQIFALLTADF